MFQPCPFNMMVAVSLYRYPDCAYTFIFRSFLNAPIRNPSFLFYPSYGFSVFDHIGIMPFYAFNSLRNRPCFPVFMVIHIKNYNDEPQKVCCIILNGSAFPCPCGYNPNKKIMVLTYTMILFQSYIIFIPFSHHQLIKIHKIRRLIK